MEERSAKILRIVLAIPLLAAVLYFLGKYFADNRESLQSFSWEANYFYMAIAFVLGAATVVITSSNWQFILRKTCNVHLSLLNAVRICSLSLLGRYVPGKIWMFAGKIYLCSMMNIPKAKAGASVLIEFIFHNLTAIYLFAFIYIFNIEMSWISRSILFSITAILVLAVPHILILFNHQIMKTAVKEPVLNSLHYRDMLAAQNRYLVSWVLQGTGLYFLIKSIHPIGFESYFVVVGYFALSCTIGVLSFLIPGGLGVREYFMLLFFRDILPIEIVLVTLVLSRLWLTVLEIITAVATQTAYSLVNRKSSN